MRSNPSKKTRKDEGPGTPRHAFTNKDTHPLVLNLLLVKEFGPEYLGWEPETCWVEIARTWKTTISEINKNKIQAVRTCHTTDQAYERWEVFDLVSAGLVGLPPKFDLIQKPTPHRAGFALDVMAQVKEGSKIGKNVHRYVAACMMDYGMIYGPGPLSACNGHVATLLSQHELAMQKRVEAALAKNRKPRFDGTNDDDVQLMKSLSVKDFLEGTSRMLLIQLKRLLS